MPWFARSTTAAIAFLAGLFRQVETMRNLAVWLACFILLGASACTRATDVEREQAALLEADRAFARTAVDRDFDRFLSFWAEDAAFLPSNAPMVTGREAIGADWAPLFNDPALRLTWEPLRAQVARAGDLGYTVGAYELTRRSPEGNPTTRRGKYLTVWKKQPDGAWKVILDSGTLDAPPAAQPN